MTSKPIIRFVKAPPLGVAIEHDSQAFEIVSVEPYTTRGGAESSLIRWATECRVCGGRFEFATGRSIHAFVKRCDAHKRRNPVERLRSNSGGKS